MFDKGSRIEHSNGIRFYEQDIQFSQYSFTGDLEAEVVLDYLSPGFGFVIGMQEAGREDVGDLCIAKVGDQEFSVILKIRGKQSRPVHVSAPIEAGQENITIRLIKKGRRVELKNGALSLGHYMMESDMDKFKVGVYSNAGNTMKSASFISGAPERWMTNVENIGGGRIHFLKDGFHMENCIHHAEVEDDSIALEAGKYFLTYDKEAMHEIFDIKAYAFNTEDRSFDMEKKNILMADSSFELEEDAVIAVHFRGTHGKITKVSIKENPLEGYVPTEDGMASSPGSEIKLKLAGLAKARWKGTVDRVPEYPDLTQVRDYAVFEMEDYSMIEKDLNVKIEELYSYSLDIHERTIEIKNAFGVSVYKHTFAVDTPFTVASIFRNLKGHIEELIVTKDSGEEVNILLQKTSKVFIPASVGGPIIVSDKEYAPLDLSSSYRALDKDGEHYYEFTNWEREIFDPARTLRLEKRLLDAPANAVAYGIPVGSRKDISRLYEAKSLDGAPSGYSDRYEVITEGSYITDLYENSITFKDDLAKKYDKVVIDYLKDRSYSINYKEDMHAYEVDVAATTESVLVMYDYKESESGVGSIEDYTITEIKPGQGGNRFVVLRKE